MFNIKFDSVEQINTLLQGLSQLPYAVAAPMIELVRKQAEEQLPSPSVTEEVSE